MGYQLLNVLMFTAFGVLFVALTVSVVGRLLRPHIRAGSEPAKEETYECGEPAVGSSWVRFDMRFYTVALIFLVFDVEVAFLYPWALVFRRLRESGYGLFLLIEVLLFLGILGVGLVYCWAKGDLDWVKTMKHGRVKTTSITPPSRSGGGTAVPPAAPSGGLEVGPTA